MNWLLWVETLAAVYLIGGALVIDASANLLSKFLFKVVPVLLGIPLAFGVAAKMLGWPV